VLSESAKDLISKRIDRGIDDILQQVGVKDNNVDHLSLDELGNIVSKVIEKQMGELIASHSEFFFSAYETDFLLKGFAEACNGEHLEAQKALEACLEVLNKASVTPNDLKTVKKTLQSFLKKKISFKDTLSIAFHEEVKAWKSADKAEKIKIIVGYLMDTFFPPVVFAKKCYDFIKSMVKNPELRAQAKQKIMDFCKNPSLNYESRKTLAKTLINIGISGIIGVATAALVFGGGVAIPFVIAFSVALGMGLISTAVNDQQEGKDFVVTLAETSNVVITNTLESIFSTLPNPGLTPFTRTFAMATNFTGPGFAALEDPLHDNVFEKLTSEETVRAQVQEEDEKPTYEIPDNFGFCGLD
jgi:hypothetical protein